MTNKRISFAVLLVLGAILLPDGQARAFPLRCALDTQCVGGQVCRQGVCRVPCSTDGECDASQQQACVVGQCMQVFPVRYPVDYGLADGNKQPGCSADADCSPVIPCVGSVCQMTTTGCKAEGLEARNEFCAPFGGYTCNASTDRCEGPACDPSLNGTDCAANYPIQGLRCVAGRCTSLCTTAADCCAAGTRCSPGREQDECYPINGSPTAGICAREIADGRLIAYQIASRDPRPPVRNLVLVSEGFKFNAANRTDLDHFVNQALRHIQWQTTRADMLAALLSSQMFNIFILELPDRFAGLGQPTLFGHFFLNRDATTWQFPGSDDQVRFMTRQAMFAYASSLSPALAPALQSSDQFTMFHAVLFNGDTNKRAHSNGADMIFQLVGNDNGPGFSGDPHNLYFVLQHELGHSLGQLSDEYDNDEEIGSPAACSFNSVARETVTDPPCTECSTSTWVPANATWGEFVNTTTFPTTSGLLTNVGLYAGAQQRFLRKAMRSQADCAMRQGGRPDFCTACREALIHNVIGDARSATFRYLDSQNSFLVPSEDGIGPNLGLAIDTAAHRVYMTREMTGGFRVLSVIDTNVLTDPGFSDLVINVELGDVGLPRTITLINQFALLEGIHPTLPLQSRVLVYDAAAKLLRPSLMIPGLLGSPVSIPGTGPDGAFVAYRRNPDTAENQMAFVELGPTGPAAPSFSVPTARAGGMPRIQQVPAFAGTANRLFFPATKVIPAETFCDFDSCQIWVFDPVSRQFVDPILTVTTPGVATAGIQAMTIGQHPAGISGTIPGELLIVATDNRVLVWRTSEILLGNTVPAASFSHSLGGTSLVTGVGFVPQTEQIVLTNRSGVVAIYGIHGEGGPDGDRLAIPDLTPGMQVRDIVVRPDGTAYVAAGGFSGPRAGVIAVLDLSGNRTGAERVVFVQPVSGIGLARPAIVVDDARSVVYSNALVDTGDATGVANNHRIRSPLIRTPHEHHSPPSGCP